MDEIRESFAQYFRTWNIQLPDPVPSRGQIWRAGWSIRYVVLQDEYEHPFLEFVADHRLTNPRHVRILNSGERIALPALEEDLSYNPDVPGDREAAEARMAAHNQAVIEELKKVGLL